MMKVKERPRKIVDEEHTIRCAGMLGLVREEVWINVVGQIVRYNLAFIHHGLTTKDNGRVLGYDNQHGRHHRHWRGETRDVTFHSYQETLDRFLNDIATIQAEAGR